MPKDNNDRDQFDQLLQQRFREAELTPPKNAFDVINAQARNSIFWKTRGFYIGIACGILFSVFTYLTVDYCFSDSTEKKHTGIEKQITIEKDTLETIESSPVKKNSAKTTTFQQNKTPQKISNFKDITKTNEPSEKEEVNISPVVNENTTGKLAGDSLTVSELSENQQSTPLEKEKKITDIIISKEETQELSEKEKLLNKLRQKADTTNSLFRSKKEEKKSSE